MKIKKKLLKLNPLGICNLKKALKDENIAIALDIVISIKSEKKPEIKMSTLDKIETHLLYLLSQVNLEKKIIKKHFEWLYNIVSCEKCQEIII